MFTASAILFWLLLALVFILAVALLAPIRLRVQLQTSPKLTYRVEVSVFGGLMRGLRIVDSARSGKPKIKKRKKKAQDKGKSRFSRGARLALELPRLFVGVLQAVRLEYLELDAEFGLQDPAETGQLYGRLASLQYGAPLPRNIVMSLRPNFERACFWGDVDASLRTRAASLLPPALRFAWRVFGPRL